MGVPRKVCVCALVTLEAGVLFVWSDIFGLSVLVTVRRVRRREGKKLKEWRRVQG